MAWYRFITCANSGNKSKDVCVGYILVIFHSLVNEVMGFMVGSESKRSRDASAAHNRFFHSKSFLITIVFHPFGTYIRMNVHLSSLLSRIEIIISRGCLIETSPSQPPTSGRRLLLQTWGVRSANGRMEIYLACSACSKRSRSLEHLRSIHCKCTE